MYILVVYDIANADSTGQRIWRHVFKTCKKYLHHVQKSVFEGDISESGLATLKQSLEKLIREDKDSILIFQSNHERWLRKEVIGLQDKQPSNLI